MLIRQDKAHNIAARADTRDTNLAALEGFD